MILLITLWFLELATKLPPEDIAGAALVLASDLSNHIVGAVINVKGGSVLFR